MEFNDGQIEKFIVEQVRNVGKDPSVLEATLRAVREKGQKNQADAMAAARAAERELARLRKATAKPEELPALHAKIQSAEQKVTEARSRLEKLKAEDVRPDDLKDALAASEPVWEQLTPKEQARVIRLLVARVDYDSVGRSVSITFRPSGIKTLANQGIEEVAA